MACRCKTHRKASEALWKSPGPYWERKVSVSAVRTAPCNMQVLSRPPLRSIGVVSFRTLALGDNLGKKRTLTRKSCVSVRLAWPNMLPLNSQYSRPEL